MPAQPMWLGWGLAFLIVGAFLVLGSLFAFRAGAIFASLQNRQRSDLLSRVAWRFMGSAFLLRLCGVVWMALSGLILLFLALELRP